MAAPSRLASPPLIEIFPRRAGKTGRYKSRIVLLEAVVVPMLRLVAPRPEGAAAQSTMDEGVDA